MRVLSRALGFITGTILARMLGVSDYGLLAWTATWHVVLMVPGTLSVEHLLVREMSRYAELQKWRLFRGLLRWALGSAFVLSLAMTAAAAAISVPSLADEPRTLVSFLLSLLTLMPACLSNQVTAAIFALNRPLIAQAVSNIFSLVLMLAGVLAVYVMVAPSQRLFGVLVVQAVVAFSALAILFALLQCIRPAESKHGRSVTLWRAWLYSAWPMLTLVIIQVAGTRLTILVLAQLRSVDEAGLLSVAMRFTELASLPSLALGPYLYSPFSRLDATGRRRDLQQLVTHSARIICLLTLPTVMLLGVTGRWLLGLFGPEFRGEYVPMMIMVVAQGASTLAGPVILLLQMTRYSRAAVISLGTGTALTLVLSLLLIPPYGTIGAAIANSLGLLLGTVVMAVFIRKRLLMDPTVLGTPPLQDQCG